ncbi:MAG: hypothetical protein Q4B57_06535 [Eubacteriales bacterium]|nr:hypothetical protein [Eubacteriales bacterium]
MEDQFIRKITNPISFEEAEAIRSLLLLAHIEVYGTSSEEADGYCYLGEKETSGDGCLYVPEADYEYAVELLTEKGYADSICRDEIRHTQTDSVEKITQEYLRKRKLHAIEWGVIILAVLVYSFIRH